VPHEHWSIPNWIDEEKARKAREDMQARQVIYGGSLPYRHMCRFQSGFFFRHELLKDYDWYWRVVSHSPSSCPHLQYSLYWLFSECLAVFRNPAWIIIVTLIMMCLNLWSWMITSMDLPCLCTSTETPSRLYGMKSKYTPQFSNKLTHRPLQKNIRNISPKAAPSNSSRNPLPTSTHLYLVVYL